MQTRTSSSSDTPRLQTLSRDVFWQHHVAQWPDSNAELITLNGEQLNWLLEGYDITRMKPHKTLHYESVC